MSRPIAKEIVAECISLRQRDQLSAPQIARRVGISHHSAYKILASYPWMPRTKIIHSGTRATWSPDEDAILKRLWPVADRDEIERALPRRKWSPISKHASDLGLKRPSDALRHNKRPVHPLMKRLREIRLAAGMTRPQLSEKTGYHVGMIHCWELGKTMPRLAHFTDLCEALGVPFGIEQGGEIKPPTPAQMMRRR